MKKTVKLFSLVLVIIMVMGCLSMQAFALEKPVRELPQAAETYGILRYREMGRVTGYGVRFRSSPGAATEATVIGLLNVGDIVQINEYLNYQNNMWCKVLVVDTYDGELEGYTGWVLASYLSFYYE